MAIREKQIIALGLVLGLAASSSAQEPEARIVHEAMPMVVPARETEMEPTPTPISAEHTSLFAENVNVRVLNEPTPEDVQQADARATALYGERRPAPTRVAIGRTFSGAPVTFANDAMVTAIDEDMSLWTISVRSAGAHGMRLRLTGVDLGDGEMLLYSRHEGRLSVRGPFRGKGPRHNGEFWTATIPGDQVYLEVTGSDQPRLTVQDILHFDADVFPSDADLDVGSVAADPVLCHIDAMCSSGPALARDATGRMNYVVGGDGFVCTGTLLNDDDGETTVPYFLSARHCISSQSVANSLEVHWLYQPSSCDGFPPNIDDMPSTVGATLLDTYSENDSSFFRLDGFAPSGTTMAGWTTAGGLDGAFGFHHPFGSWKRAVNLSTVGVCPGCTCLDPTDFDYYNMTSGLTEGGSSGSGVFNSNGQIAGQLYGKCAIFTDEEIACDTIDRFWAVYGEFEETYPRISHWFRIGGTIWVDRDFSVLLPQEGSESAPFRTIAQALDLAWDGARIKIVSGFYEEHVIFSGNLTVMATDGVVIIAP